MKGKINMSCENNCINCTCNKNISKLKVTLLNHTPKPEKLIAAAAKLCYSKSDIKHLYENQTPEKVETFINKLILLHHESPLEHISFSFGIEGISRSLTHQLVRHRIASYSQKSQRYVSENQFQYVIPDQIKDNYSTNKIYNDLMENIQEQYNNMFNILMFEKIKDTKNINDWDKYTELFNNKEINIINVINEFKEYNKKLYSQYEKSIIEDVRYILPNAAETKIIVTMNFRSLMNFWKERTCNRAQWEIRQMALEMIKLVKPIIPTLYKLLCPECVSGICKEGNMSCGKAKEIKELFNNL